MNFISKTKVAATNGVSHTTTLLGIAGLSAIALLLVPESALAGCTSGCTTSAWQERASFSLSFDGAIAPTSEQPVVLTGFGYGLANNSDILRSNPLINNATVTWQDFRFYADIPSLGIVKGTLNRDSTSFVSLSANTSSNLFPAEFTNNLYLTLSPIAFPELQYKNSQAVQVHAPSILSAPPDSTVQGTQVHAQDVFDVVTPLPGAPTQIIISGGVQQFMTPQNMSQTNLSPQPGGVSLKKLSTNNELWSFQVSNPYNKQLKVAYFAHTNDDTVNPLVVQNLDGVLEIEPLGKSEFRINLQGISIDDQSRIIVEAMDLDLSDNQGINSSDTQGLYERLIFTRDGSLSSELCAVPEPSTIVGSGLALGFGALFKKEYSKKCKKQKVS